jgi:HEAT repeat protein
MILSSPRHALRAARLLALVGFAALARQAHAADEAVLEPAAKPTQQELMAERGFVRYRGAWRTVQEIELIERAERSTLAQKEWNAKLDRLRRQLDQPSLADRAAEEIREISDPFAVPALTVALGKERVFRVRGWYVEALSRIRSPDAIGALVAVALDHADPETRIAAVERLVVIGPHLAVPTLVSALRSADNPHVNPAAEALGRLGVPSAVGPLIEALETTHVISTGDGAPEGSTSATFTPGGGGLSMGSGPKRRPVAVRNERVLEALVALTGANFEWDSNAWRAWFANRQAPPPGFDPRRG